MRALEQAKPNSGLSNLSPLNDKIFKIYGRSETRECLTPSSLIVGGLEADAVTGKSRKNTLLIIHWFVIVEI